MADFLPGLSDALHASRSGRGGRRDRRECAVCVVIRHATPGQHREVLIRCAAGRISGRALQQSLQQVGIRVSRESITNHRNEAHQP